jgi:hypothetical protein
VDRGGNVHLAFSQCNYNSASGNSSNCSVYLMSSSDQGNTWLSPVQVNNGADTSYAIFPWIVAGSAGVVDITWYGANINQSTQSASWHLYFSQATNVMSNSPVFSQVQAIPQVVHNEDICLKGGACGGNRDLAEYYTITLDQQGNANIAFPDDVTSNISGLGRTWFTKQTGGPSAYTPPTAPAPATFAANITMPSSNGDAEPNMKADSHNCLFSATPGAPPAWKSTNGGLSFFLLPNPVTSAGGIAGGGDSDILPVPQPSGPGPDQLYFADLAVASVNISKSTDGGATWFSPGPGGAAGEVSVSTDRQWMAADRNGLNQTIYLWEHEFVSQILRMNALTNDMVWSPFASGMMDPELIAPPGSTLQNTVPGPCFVDPATHVVYGFLGASTVTTNVVGAPAGKLPNVWEADGPGTFTAGVPPGPFTNHPVWKGVINSPTTPAPPAGSATVGSNTANLFNGATIDKAGNIYVSWSTPNARNGLYDVWFASSHDHGQTYYGPFKINPNGMQGNMPWIAAGDNGRVAIVFYGTTGTQDPTTSSTNQWNVLFAQSLNGADREPVFTVVQASDHITHTGPICNVGILCSGGTRQLLDFFQVAIGPDGLANIAWADTGNGNGTPHVSYARQASGPLALVNPTFPTCVPGPPVPTLMVSRKAHGTTNYDVDLLPPVSGIECRTGGPNGDFKIVVDFPSPVTLSGSPQAQVTSGTGSISNVTVSGNEVTVDLTGVTNAQRLVVRLNGVTDANGSGNVPVSMAVLLGDTTADGSVNSADISQTKSRSGQVVGSGNFRSDVTVDNAINSADISLVKSKSGTALP